LLEHNQEPYCKACHTKNFGTRDLRQANLPYRARSPPLSPSSGTPSSPTRVYPFVTGNGYPPLLQLNHSLSPTNASFRRTERVESPTSLDEEAEEAKDVVPDNIGRISIESPPITSNATGLSQIVGNDEVAAAAALDKYASTLGRSNGNGIRPIMQTPTGTRYGIALGGSVATHSTGSPRKWGGNTPSCARCSKPVYFAEQVKAVGKTWHKVCLRCAECNTTLDSTKLRDHEDTPFCSRCYNKLHGPQGNGYALLGKAGG
jgi:hypothetical protein